MKKHTKALDQNEFDSEIKVRAFHILQDFPYWGPLGGFYHSPSLNQIKSVLAEIKEGGGDIEDIDQFIEKASQKFIFLLKSTQKATSEKSFYTFTPKCHSKKEFSSVVNCLNCFSEMEKTVKNERQARFARLRYFLIVSGILFLLYPPWGILLSMCVFILTMLTVSERKDIWKCKICGNSFNQEAK